MGAGWLAGPCRPRRAAVHEPHMAARVRSWWMACASVWRLVEQATGAGWGRSIEVPALIESRMCVYLGRQTAPAGGCTVVPNRPRRLNDEPDQSIWTVQHCSGCMAFRPSRPPRFFVGRIAARSGRPVSSSTVCIYFMSLIDEKPRTQPMNTRTRPVRGGQLGPTLSRAPQGNPWPHPSSPVSPAPSPDDGTVACPSQTGRGLACTPVACVRVTLTERRVGRGHSGTECRRSWEGASTPLRLDGPRWHGDGTAQRCTDTLTSHPAHLHDRQASPSSATRGPGLSGASYTRRGRPSDPSTRR